MAMKQIIEHQNKWASDPANADLPYRTPKLDIDLWKTLGSIKYDVARALCMSSESYGTGINWNQSYDTWEDFTSDEKHVWPMEKFFKDLTKDKRPQRPYDAEHLYDMIKQSKGIFNHALASMIDVAVRPDGSINTWDHWHTVLLAYMCGVTHLRVNVNTHPTNLNLEQCRAVECGMYDSRNGKSKKSSAEDIFEKEAVKLKGDNADPKINPTLALENIFEQLNISLTGKNTNFSSINGVKAIKKTRGDLIKHYGKPEIADRKIKSYLSAIKECFPQEVISSHVFRGICHLLMNFEDQHPDLTIGSLSEMFKHKKLNGCKQSHYTSNGSVNDVSVKNQPAETVSLRLLHAWSEWMFTSGQKKRRPISKKSVVKVFQDILSEIEIDQKFDSGSEMFKIQCSHCQNITSKSLSQLRV